LAIDLDTLPEAGETDGYDWAIDQIREIVNNVATVAEPPRSLRTFNLINQLVEIISDADNKDDNEPDGHPER
jgi:hypothetical protein